MGGEEEVESFMKGIEEQTSGDEKTHKGQYCPDYEVGSG